MPHSGSQAASNPHVTVCFLQSVLAHTAKKTRPPGGTHRPTATTRWPPDPSTFPSSLPAAPGG